MVRAERGGVWLALMIILTLSIRAPCSAAEGGLGAYWPGYRSFLTGTLPPPKPGLYLRNDIVFYSARVNRVVLNGFPVQNASVDAVVDFIQPMYVFPNKLFGANHAFLITQTFAWAKLNDEIIGTDFHASDSRVAPGDIAISPLFLGWNRGNLHYNANLAIFIPTGGYNIKRAVNISRNYWTFNPEFGITYLDLRKGLDISAAIGYSINTENGATRYTSGQVLHLDYTIGQMLKSGVEVGIAGYAWMQVTPDTGPGAIFGAFESRVAGIGPGVRWKTGRNSQMEFHYYNEFWAENRLQGNQYRLGYRVAF